MKFGSVEDPGSVDFTLPADHTKTTDSLSLGKGLTSVSVGCAKWNRQDLKKFYPRGTKDELTYYSSQFNSIELNATFYNNYGPDQIIRWKDKTPEDFRFFPKVPQTISHFGRLKNVDMPMHDFVLACAAFEQKLGMAFLQLHDNFKPDNIELLTEFLEKWSPELPLAVELRNSAWFNDIEIANQLYSLLEENQVANIITDTAGRRDLLHMRLTSPTAFIRFVGANHSSDISRLDEWLNRLGIWMEQGLERIYFFVHQNLEKESPFLAKYFIEEFNRRFNQNVRGPVNVSSTPELF